MKRFNLQKSILFSLVFILLPIFWAINTANAGWSPPVRISQPGDCWDPQIISSGDTLHVVYENTGERYDKINYVGSTDGGASWSTPVRLTERQGPTLFPRIMKNGQRLMTLWQQEFNTGYYIYNIGYAISSNNGANWDSAQYIFNPNWQHILDFAAANYDSMVVLTLSSQVAYNLVYYSLHSTNFGTSWSHAQEMFACYQSNRLDFAQSQELSSLVWSGRFDASQEYEVYNTNSFDFGIHWTQNEVLSDTDMYHSQIPAIAIDSLIKIAVCWMDYKYAPYGSGTGDIFLRQSYNSGNNWDPTIELVYNHRAFKSDLAVNGDTINLVWNDETYGLFHSIIRYIRSTDGGIAWSDPLWLDSTIYHSSEDPALAVSNGQVNVVWNGYRGMPDSSALYFSYSPYEPTSVGNQRDTNLPDNIELSAYPNPFNSSTVIEYDLAVPSEVSIGIFDILGRRVETLEQGSQPAGPHSVIWDAGGQSSGIYFYRLKAGDKTETRKMVLIK